MSLGQIPRRRHFVFKSQTKLIEWIMTAFMLAWALTMAMPASTFSISTYRDFVVLGIDQSDLAIFYSVVGLLRAYVLYRNGTLARGPEIRFFCSLVAGMTWLLTAMLFALPWLTQDGRLPVNALQHLVMFCAEIYSIGVASFDRTNLRK